MSSPHFHELQVKRVSPEAAGALAIALAVPTGQRHAFAFEPGQYLTLRARIEGQDVRRSYSISSPRSRLARLGGRKGRPCRGWTGSGPLAPLLIVSALHPRVTRASPQSGLRLGK